MENKPDRLPENVPGAWYVNTNCVICKMCGEYAPAVFKTSEDHDHNCVHHQPETEEELRLAEEMRDHCPVEAICNDGEQLA
jgi:ferredoxin